MKRCQILAGLCALLPVSCIALYLGFFADFSGKLRSLNADEFSRISGCYVWREYTIKVENSSIKFLKGNKSISQSSASYANSRDVRVISDIRLELDPRQMTIGTVKAPSTQTYIHMSSILSSKPYFIVFDPIPPSSKFVKFEKSDC